MKNRCMTVWTGLLLLLCTLVSLAAHADSSIFTVFIDRDQNPGTGCSSRVPNGPTVNGAEFRIDVTVNIAAPPTVASANLTACDTAVTPPVFSNLPTPLGEGRIGLNIGIDRSDVIEFSAPLVAMNLKPGDVINATVVGFNGQVSSPLLTVLNFPVPDAAAPIAPIPTLSFYGSLALVLVLLGLSWRYLPRGGWANTAVMLLSVATLAAHAANFIVDGQIPDWTGETPVVTSPPSSDPTINVRQVFIGQEGGTLFFRLDVTNLESNLPPAKVSVTARMAGQAASGQTVSLVGLTNASPAGTTYQWSQTAGPTVTITNATQANATFVAPSVTTPTVLTFTLTVTDSTGQPTSTSVSTTVNPVVNLIVEALGGPRQAITGDTVSLHAQCTGATTPIYTWTQVSPATPAVTLTNANTENPTFTAPSVAQYTTFNFQVECTDASNPNLKATANSVVYVNYATPTPGGPGTVNAPTVVAVPPQVLRLLAAPPSVTVVGGQTVKLSIPATGGTQPYTWTWTQTAGTTVATSVDAATGIATVIAPTVTAQETLTYQMVVTDSATPAATQTATVSVTVIPAPTLQPLTALVPTTLFVDEGKSIALWAQPQGGNGSYLYNWVYVPSDPSIVVSLTGANTSHPSFTAPAVTATTQLRFKVTISDTAGNGGGTLSIFVQVNDLAPTLGVATASDVTANSGDATVSLNFPKPKGGVGPYTYAIAQTAGPTVTLSSATARNPAFTAPTLAPGAPDATLTFVMTVTDSLGNQTQATENVVIKAPQAVPLAATLTGPAAADQGAVISLNASAAGGVGTYTYSYAVTGGTLTIPATANPTVTLPTIAAGGTNLALTLTVTVTDSATPANTATATLALTVNAPPAPQVSTGALSCVQCGDLEFEEPCTATQLIFDEVTLCPGNEVVCMTDAKTDSDGYTTIYKRCVDQPTCHTLWYLESSDQNVCRNFDSSTTDVLCHFCYLGSGSNVGGPNDPENTGFPLYNGSL